MDKIIFICNILYSVFYANVYLLSFFLEVIKCKLLCPPLVIRKRPFFNFKEIMSQLEHSFFMFTKLKNELEVVDTDIQQVVL